MRKNKILKNLTTLGIMFSVLFSAVFVTSFSTTATAETTEEESTEVTEMSSDNQMLHFIMKVRWGNVVEDPHNSAETNFDGSISVSDSARVSLERTLLFEKHSAEAGVADIITKRTDPVLWKSLIYNHWDGLKVLVSSPANDNVTITTTQGNVIMTAQKLYNLNAPYIEDVGEGREIVIKTYPIKNPRYFLKVVWGKTSRTDYALKGEADDIESQAVMAGNAIKRIVKNKFGKDITIHNANGYFKINSGGTLNLIKTLRFEGLDKITAETDSKIEWASHVAQGVDGILVKLNLDANNLDDSDTVTISFTDVEIGEKTGWSKDFNIIDLYHNRRTNETIESGYGVMLQVWRKPNRALIRVRNQATVYMVEDGVKQPIPSPEVLESQGLTFDDVEEVEQDEADTYGDGEAVCYKDGTLVREKNKPEVYVITDGEKKHIENPEAFEDLFGKERWGNIVETKDGALGLYANRAALKSSSVYPEGSLIREMGTQTVYIVEGGKKKPITSYKIFIARGLDWNKVVEINKVRISEIQTANETLKYPDGAVVRNPAGKVYVMDQGKKRWIRSGDDLAGAGYKAEEIIDVEDSTEINDLAITEEGNDIFSDDV